MSNRKVLSDEEWDRLQAISEHFEADSREFDRKIGPYLPPTNDPIRARVLDELIRIDMELRWKAGRPIYIEDYLREFPEIREPRSTLLDLIEEEFRVRGQFGDHPSVSDFYPRFPELKADLDKLLTPSASGEFQTLESAIDIPYASQGNLKKVRLIGEGGFGEVWECLAPGGVHVAVKRLFATVSPSFIEREKQSLDLICSGNFRHPFLLQLFGWWVQKDQIHIVMELAEESLDRRLKDAKGEGRQGLSRAELKRIMRDAGDALDFLNFERHILHRDVKPANMLLMGGRLKLCDFGLARMSENLPVGAGKTQGAGTPVFIAPEIVKGYQSMQGDQYSLAASYCMLRSGKPLFRGSIKQIREQQVSAQPSLAEDVFSPAERRALERALSKEPADRYPTSSAFVDDLFSDMNADESATTAPPKKPAESQASIPTQPLGVTDRSSPAMTTFIPVKRVSPTRVSQITSVSIRKRWPAWQIAFSLLVLGVIFLVGVVIYAMW